LAFDDSNLKKGRDAKKYRGLGLKSEFFKGHTIFWFFLTKNYIKIYIKGFLFSKTVGGVNDKDFLIRLLKIVLPSWTMRISFSFSATLNRMFKEAIFLTLLSRLSAAGEERMLC
jgi:hypothetical protein